VDIVEMRNRYLTGIVVMAAFLLFTNSVFAQTTPNSDDEVVRVDSDITNLFFTVTDKQRRFITTVQQADVQVFEDGSPQQILVFQRETDRPVSLAFLIDVSSSEARALPQLKQAARSFMESIIRSKEDEAALVPFTERAFLEQPFTGNLLALYRVLGQLEVAFPEYLGLGRPISGLPSGPGTSAAPMGTTAIWDAVALTASEVIAPRVGIRRRAIILLTDGRDTSSRLKREAAIERAITAETVIYVIGIGDESLEGVDKGPLQKLAEATGGRAFFPKKEVDLKTAFSEIETELRTQYLVAYSSTNKNRDGKFRQMRIEVTNPELRALQLKLRHRPGYYAKRLTTSVP
jgi:Ca-activated chloride channel homolog